MIRCCLHSLSISSGAVVSNFFDLATPFEIITSALEPSPYLQLQRCSNNNREDKNVIILPVRFTVFTFLCKTNSTYANQWDDWACICATSLEIFGGVLVRTNLMSFWTDNLFLDFCFDIDKGYKSSLTDRADIRISRSEANFQKGALKQLLRGPLWHICM